MIFIKKNKNNIANAVGVMNCQGCKFWAANSSGSVDSKNKSYCTQLSKKTSAKAFCSNYESDI